MPGIVRVGDKCTGHGCWPPRPAIQGSPSVFVNQKAVVRQGDKYAIHCKECSDKRPCHDGAVIKASSNIFINGIEAVRVGDPLNCGSAASNASTDTFGSG